MCGIVGIANLRREPIADGLLKRMTTVMAHRGPDGEGHFVDGPVGLGHRRLAIIDLTPAGHQPMANETGDVFITFNGEIYNFRKLRVELEAFGHRFHSQTDTEVIIHGYEQWGKQCLQHFNGMFAFAIWDQPRQRLFLARDRFGIKPLYWYCCNGTFIFASEIKAILEHPGVKRSVCYPALNEYFSFQNIFTDLTLFEGIRLLPPGSHLTLDVTGENEPQIKRYWDYPVCTDDSSLSEGDCAEKLHQLFSQSVTRQLVSDVPVGSYLSGGMDSGSITAVAVRNLPRLTTFTCGFDLTSASGLELGFDERPNAEVLANLFKTEHYEFVLHAGDMESVLPAIDLAPRRPARRPVLSKLLCGAARQQVRQSRPFRGRRRRVVRRLSVALLPRHHPSRLGKVFFPVLSVLAAARVRRRQVLIVQCRHQPAAGRTFHVRSLPRRLRPGVPAIGNQRGLHQRLALF